MKTEKTITIEVHVGSPYSPFCLAWVYDGARYHVWLNRATKELEQRVLFKNSIPNRGETGYFECRRLKADIERNAELIGLAMHMATVGDLFNKAEQKMRDEEAAQTGYARTHSAKPYPRESARYLSDAGAAGVSR